MVKSDNEISFHTKNRAMKQRKGIEETSVHIIMWNETNWKSYILCDFNYEILEKDKIMERKERFAVTKGESNGQDE